MFTLTDDVLLLLNGLGSVVLEVTFTVLLSVPIGATGDRVALIYTKTELPLLILPREIFQGLEVMEFQLPLPIRYCGFTSQLNHDEPGA